MSAGWGEAAATERRGRLFLPPPAIVRSAGSSGRARSSRVNEEAEYLTREGYARLEAELRGLIHIRRPEVAELIRDAKEAGDVMENAAYDEAKDQQAFVEGRIMHLEDILKRAVVIESPDRNDTVAIGSLVTIAEAASAPERFRIVGSAEANPSLGMISNESLLGRALLGKRVGEHASYTSPDGETLTFEVIEIA
jgi:transcription elongation factor GreA